MRTTINLDDRLLAGLKKRAAESGSSVSQLIEQALRLFMRQSRTERKERFELVTFGAGGRFSAHNMDKTSSLLEASQSHLHS